MTGNVIPSVRRDDEVGETARAVSMFRDNAMVVKLHQGEVFAESLEGVGSRFVVRLPVDSVSTL